MKTLYIPFNNYITFSCICFLFFLGHSVFAQLSDLHYLPPLKQTTNNVAITNQSLYISTPETVAFNVHIYRGNSTTPFATVNVSNAIPYVYTLPDGDNDISLVSNTNTGVVLSNSGLRLQSAGGQKFYVNYRGRNGAQGTSLTSKGRQALGTSFKWGGLPAGASTNNSGGVNATLGIMATEDGTVVDVFGYDPAINFRLGANASGMTDDTKQIMLNAGQSFVFEVVENRTAAHKDGWLGASIVSNKKIAISNGSLLLRGIDDAAGGGWDAGIDQPSPENIIGKEYVLVRGNGIDAQEYGVVIATQNETDVYVNGSSTPIRTLNAGDYTIIPSTNNYSVNTAGGNMFVTANKDIYVYQVLSGDSQIATGGLNFISPVNCLMFSTIDNIPSINEVAGLTVTGGVTIIASTAISNNDIVITYGTTTKTAADYTVRTVAGTTEWKTIYASGLTGNVKVAATGPIAVGYTGVSGLIGVAGYYSGLDNVPNLVVQLVGDGCLPGTILQATEGFSSYSWFNEGVLMPGETGTTLTPSVPGKYSVEVVKGSCIYESAPQIVVNCNPEIVLSNVADVSSGQPGDMITFTIKAKYIGEGTLSNLVINNVIPNGLTLSSVTPSFGTWSGSGQNYNWNIGTMYNGEEHILTVKTTVDNIASSFQATYTVSNTQTQLDGNTLADDPSETVLLHKIPLPTLSSFGDINKMFFDGTFALKAPVSNSLGNFTYSSSNSAVATVIGNVVTIKGPGTATITATQAAVGGFDQAFITANLRVNLTEAILTNFGESIATKINYVNANGKISDEKGMVSGGKLINVKSPLNTDPNLMVWLDSEAKSSYNRLDNTWYDLSGHFNNGLLKNNFNYNLSNVNSFVFNGVNNFVNLNDTYPNTNELTFETWVYPKALSNGSYYTLIGHDGTTSGTLSFYFLGNTLKFGINGIGTNNFSYTFNPNNWYHLSVVYSKTGDFIKFFVNGILSDQISLAGNSTTTVSQPFKIGSWEGTSRFFNGDMAMFKIYTRALSSSELTTHFNNNKGRFGIN
ncbi:LamG-like jellyroll fold domain-containing protein [Confluentibacter sediminis]|uniref:LamG-like jellyroll fold domain-containing protein n=1 Tax=Confluentibacter sediminis TaxID=2219045 RepID=UPI000DAE880B|nr:LamG-like jellyroll fold domain-containing protein [Confluentibacter sediminis]